MRLEPTITSVQNAWVKEIKRLHHSSNRYEQQKFLIEGSHLVEEALATGWPLEAICFDANWARNNQEILAAIDEDASRRNVLLQPASEAILRQLSTTDSACSVIAVALQGESIAFAPRELSLAIAVESVQDPGNLGALIRIAAAAGIGPIILSPDSVDPFNPKVLRSTAGQWFRGPPVVVDLLSLLRSQRKKNVQILAASANGKSFWECDLTVPTIFLLGNEGAGLSSELRAEATDVIAIPMAEGVESLNVAVTGALLIFEAQRQRKTAREKRLTGK